MGKPHEVDAANWLLTKICFPDGTTVQNGSPQDDWDVRDVWLDIPGKGRFSMGVRVYDVGTMHRDLMFRVKTRGDDGAFHASEYQKLSDRSRQGCQLYLQKWNGPEPEYVLLNIAKARKLGLFSSKELLETGRWSWPTLNGWKDSYWTDISIPKMLEIGCVMKCDVFSRPTFGSDDLDANIYGDERLRFRR